MATEQQPAKFRSRRMYIMWSVALALLVAAGLFSWLVAVPVWRVKRALASDPRQQYSPEGPGTSAGRLRLLKAELAWTRESTESLGGPLRAAGALRCYLRMPDSLAPAEARARAVTLLARCGRRPELYDPARHPKEKLPPFIYCIRAEEPTSVLDQVIDVLNALLADESVHVRAEAIRSLVWLGPCASKAAPALTELTKSKDPDIRQLASRALEKVTAAKDEPEVPASRP